MTTEELIKTLREKTSRDNRDLLDEAARRLEELNAKQMPKKPLNKGCLGHVDKYTFGECPSCKIGVNYEMCYCDYCGQALDWSDDK